MPENQEELFEAFLNREIQTMEIYLWGKAMRTSITIQEYIQARLAQGATREAIKADLLNDLKTGGRIFGEFRSGIKATANGTINRIRDAGSYSVFGVNRQYRWAAVLVNTCPDCVERHGQVKTWEEWEAEGMPRTGATVCKENCKCALIPASESVLEPIRRGH